jgi:hypothetical protein
LSTIVPYSVGIAASFSTSFAVDTPPLSITWHRQRQQDLYINELLDLYSVEIQLIEALPSAVVEAILVGK